MRMLFESNREGLLLIFPKKFRSFRVELLNSFAIGRYIMRHFDNKSVQMLFWFGFLVAIIFTYSATLMIPNFEYNLQSFFALSKLEEQSKLLFMVLFIILNFIVKILGLNMLLYIGSSHVSPKITPSLSRRRTAPFFSRFI